MRFAARESCGDSLVLVRALGAATRRGVAARAASSVVKVARGRGWTLYCAEALSWLTRQSDGDVDALITDPPYSSGGAFRGDRMLPPSKKYRTTGAAARTACFDGDTRDQRSYASWCALWLAEAYRMCRNGAPACVFADWRQLPTTTDAFQAGGFVWRGIAVWTKSNATRPQLGRFRHDAEFVVWGSRGGMPARAELGALHGSWDMPPVHSSVRQHLTEKPVAAMERVVQIAPVGGLVLDPFAGSGSTGLACLRLGRRFVGLERDPAIFAVAVTRLREEERSLRPAARRAA